MSEIRQRQFASALKAVLFPILGVLPGFIPAFYYVKGLPLVLLVAGLIAGGKSLSNALESAPDVRPIALCLYFPVMLSFLVGFCLLFGMFLHLLWIW